MMREILFRGKRIDNGEWVEGDICRSAQQIYINPNHNSFRVTKAGLSKLLVMHEINPNTLGQSTGLTDKNGVKIFEGDIVRLERWVPSCGKTEVVKYYDGGFAPFSVAGWECTADWEECEVIGNIHDNYELLGGE